MRTIAIVIFLLLPFACTFAQWSYLGLGHTHTNHLLVSGDSLLASTEAGLFSRGLTAVDTNWTALGLSGENVVQSLVTDAGQVISLVEVPGTFRTRIFRSTDGGANFSLWLPDTSRFSDYNFLERMAHPPGNFDSLYFVHHRLYTLDGGLTWDSLQFDPQVDRFIMVDPENHHRLIRGGETGFFTAFLAHSTDQGQTWTRPNMTNYYSGDNVVHDLFVQNGTWYAVGEGIVSQSTDQGQNWSNLVDLLPYGPRWGLYLTAMVPSPTLPGYFYTSGFTALGYEDVPLITLQAGSGTWDTLSWVPPTNLSGYVTTLVAVEWNGQDRVFLGGNGVFLYQNPLVSNGETPSRLSGVQVFPNPSTGILNVLSESNLYRWGLHDLQGRPLLQQSGSRSGMDLSHLPDGCYFVWIQKKEKGEIQRQKIILHQP